MQAVRSGLLLAAGGEFAFVALCAPPGPATRRKACAAQAGRGGLGAWTCAPACPHEHTSFKAHALASHGQLRRHTPVLPRLHPPPARRPAGRHGCRVRWRDAPGRGARSGEAMAHKLVDKALVSELFLVVALTMALTPFLAELGARLGKAFESSDFKARRRARTARPPRPGRGCLGLPRGARRGWAGDVAARGAADVGVRGCGRRRGPPGQQPLSPPRATLGGVRRWALAARARAPGRRRCKRRRARLRRCAATSSSAASGAWGRPSGSCWPSGSSPLWRSTCAWTKCRRARRRAPNRPSTRLAPLGRPPDPALCSAGKSPPCPTGMCAGGALPAGPHLLPRQRQPLREAPAAAGGTHARLRGRGPRAGGQGARPARLLWRRGQPGGAAQPGRAPRGVRSDHAGHAGRQLPLRLGAAQALPARQELRARARRDARAQPGEGAGRAASAGSTGSGKGAGSRPSRSRTSAAAGGRRSA